METTPTALAAKAGISLPYASQLLSGKREPGYAAALKIWRATQMKFGDLVGMSDEQVEALDAHDRARAA